MQLTLVVIRLTLSAIFGVAGIAKLLDRRGTREAVLNFGTPSALAGPIVILLPISELAVAASLLFGQTAWWGALAALFLLILFIGLIGVNLLHGRAPECHCFGQLYSRPLGWPTLVRNGAFAVCAVFVVWQGFTSAGPNVWAFFWEFNAGRSRLAVGGSFLAALVSVTLVLLYLRQRRLKEQEASQQNSSVASGLPVDSAAPAFELTAYDGGTRSLRQLLDQQKAVMLIFANPNCGPCVALFQEVGEWQRTYVHEITIAVISQGTIKDNFVNTARNKLRNVLLQAEHEIAEIYGARVTPSALVVLQSGKIGSGVHSGGDEIRLLINRTIEGQVKERQVYA